METSRNTTETNCNATKLAQHNGKSRNTAKLAQHNRNKPQHSANKPQRN